MRVFKKGGAVCVAMLAMAAVAASPALASGSGSGTIHVTSPSDITCPFDYTYDGDGPNGSNLPTSIEATDITLDESCPSNVTVNDVGISFASGAGNPATAHVDIDVDLGLWTCNYASSSVSGSWTSGPPWTFSATGAMISGTGFICPTATADATISGS